MTMLSTHHLSLLEEIILHNEFGISITKTITLLPAIWRSP